MSLKQHIIKSKKRKRFPLQVIYDTLKPFGVSAPKTIAAAVFDALRREKYLVK